MHIKEQEECLQSCGLFYQDKGSDSTYHCLCCNNGACFFLGYSLPLTNLAHMCVLSFICTYMVFWTYWLWFQDLLWDCHRLLQSCTRKGHRKECWMQEASCMVDKVSKTCTIGLHLTHIETDKCSSTRHLPTSLPMQSPIPLRLSTAMIQIKLEVPQAKCFMPCIQTCYSYY